MKTIIGILIFLLIGLGVSAQPHVKQDGYVEHSPRWEKTKHLPLDNNYLPLGNPDRRQRAVTIGERIYDYGFYDEKGELIVQSAHFVANGRLFMLSYEPLAERIATDVPENLKNQEVLEAELYLYSIDLSAPKSNWEIASIEKIRDWSAKEITYNYKPCNLLICSVVGGDYSDVDFYMYGEGYDTDIGKVIEHKDGRVEIFANIYTFKNGSKIYNKDIKFVFTPVDDRHYTCEIIK